jgi:hypothetical protein
LFAGRAAGAGQMSRFRIKLRGFIAAGICIGLAISFLLSSKILEHWAALGAARK